MKACTLAILSLIVASSCVEEVYDYRIDPSLKPYLDDFYKEAEARNYFISRENLKLVLESGLERKENAVGQARTSAIGQKTIAIDRAYFELNSTSVNGRLLIMRTVFHEFGHLYFKRKHENNPMSVMMIDSQTAIDNWIRFPDKRQLIIDDLFSN